MVSIAVLLLIPPSIAFLGAGNAEEKDPPFGEVSGPQRDGYTAITTQQFRSSNPQAELIILDPNGSAKYIVNRYTTYYDVDPARNRSMSVEYVAANHLPSDRCNASVRCTRSVFVRENFSTGDYTVLWSRIVPRPGPDTGTTVVHDIDRVNHTHILVADIKDDSVFLYDLERGVKDWEWAVQRDYPIEGGGDFPKDWTHVNDVEWLGDGSIMVSLRNQDSVVFLSSNGSLLSERTLGSDGNHAILYEQHNPDYIPNKPGNPSVLVADSHNNRVVEYEYRGGSWTRIWIWRDRVLQWPRDADRLPDGHTLITDTHGGRVLEIDESGDVIWSVTVGLPYEAERLSTRDESGGGQTARSIGITSLNVTQTDSNTSLKRMFFSLLSPKLINSIKFIYPNFLEWWHGFLLLGVILDIFVWGTLEYRWSDWRIRLPLTRVK